MCNVYRRFVPNFARVAVTLNRLLRKKQPSEYPLSDEKQSRAFETLKSSLIEPQVLQLPHSALLFSVDTDACKDQVGCTILQTYSDCTRHLIGFWSRSLTKAEWNYSNGERGFLAAIWAVKILRLYLERRHLELYTNHQALMLMMELTDVNNRLDWWSLKLMEYEFKVFYRKGAKNKTADAISQLLTRGYTTTERDFDIPCFLVFCETKDSVEVVENFDSPSLEMTDWDPDYDARITHRVLAAYGRPRLRCHQSH